MSSSDFVAIEDRLSTMLGEHGVRLSGGQKQGISLAEHFINKNILILDESTSSIDKSTEDEILEQIFALKNKKTLLIIAHRPSTINRCSKILKIDNGQATLLLNEWHDKKKKMAYNDVYEEFRISV